MFSFGVEGFSSSLDVLYGGPGINTSKLQVLIKNIKKFSAVNFFSNFWSSKPWIRIRSAFNLKCWIQNQWIRIRNIGTGYAGTVPCTTHVTVPVFEVPSPRTWLFQRCLHWLCHKLRWRPELLWNKKKVIIHVITRQWYEDGCWSFCSTLLRTRL